MEQQINSERNTALSSALQVFKADLNVPSQQSAILSMLDLYSSDPMGDGHPLSTYAKEHLIAGLQAHPTTIVFLAYFEDAPCGIATCFRGFSTFAAKPLVNISSWDRIPLACPADRSAFH